MPEVKLLQLQQHLMAPECWVHFDRVVVPAGRRSSNNRGNKQVNRRRGGDALHPGTGLGSLTMSARGALQSCWSLN